MVIFRAKSCHFARTLFALQMYSQRPSKPCIARTKCPTKLKTLYNPWDNAYSLWNHFRTVLGDRSWNGPEPILEWFWTCFWELFHNFKNQVLTACLHLGNHFRTALGNWSWNGSEPVYSMHWELFHNFKKQVLTVRLHLGNHFRTALGNWSWNGSEPVYSMHWELFHNFKKQVLTVRLHLGNHFRTALGNWSWNGSEPVCTGNCSTILRSKC